jgi:hypothetical protein
LDLGLHLCNQLGDTGIVFLFVLDLVKKLQGLLPLFESYVGFGLAEPVQQLCLVF